MVKPQTDLGGTLKEFFIFLPFMLQMSEEFSGQSTSVEFVIVKKKLYAWPALIFAAWRCWSKISTLGSCSDPTTPTNFLI
jgi:hypothetical protein